MENLHRPVLPAAHCDNASVNACNFASDRAGQALGADTRGRPVFGPLLTRESR